MGVLVDTTRCIGCRACEVDCSEANNLPVPDIKNDGALAAERTTSETQWMVVNRYETEKGEVFVKKQCMHCRFCMISCPFDIPKFEYNSPNPLWFSEFIPILFFASSIFAGLSMVFIEGSISQRVFKDLIDSEHNDSHNEIIIGLVKFEIVAIFVYYFFKLLTFLHNKQWAMLNDFLGF